MNKSTVWTMEHNRLMHDLLKLDTLTFETIFGWIAAISKNCSWKSNL